jgi:hypothetical protein
LVRVADLIFSCLAPVRGEQMATASDGSTCNEQEEHFIPAAIDIKRADKGENDDCPQNWYQGHYRSFLAHWRCLRDAWSVERKELNFLYFFWHNRAMAACPWKDPMACPLVSCG